MIRFSRFLAALSISLATLPVSFPIRSDTDRVRDEIAKRPRDQVESAFVRAARNRYDFAPVNLTQECARRRRQHARLAAKAEAA